MLAGSSWEGTALFCRDLAGFARSGIFKLGFRSYDIHSFTLVPGRSALVVKAAAWRQPSVSASGRQQFRISSRLSPACLEL